MSFIAPIASAAITGGLSFLGGQSANAATAHSNDMSNVFNMISQNNQTATSWDQLHETQGYNSDEAQKGRDFAQSTLNQAKDYDQASQQRQMDFEANMSSTAYQRAVADMKKAGINPIMAAGNGGASTPSAAAPTISGMSTGNASSSDPTGVGLQHFNSTRFNNSLGDAASTALQAAKIGQDVANTGELFPIVKETARTGSDNASFMGDKIEAEARQAQMQGDVAAATRNLVEAQTASQKASAAQIDASTEKIKAETANTGGVSGHVTGFIPGYGNAGIDLSPSAMGKLGSGVQQLFSNVSPTSIDGNGVPVFTQPGANFGSPPNDAGLNAGVLPYGTRENGIAALRQQLNNR